MNRKVLITIVALLVTVMVATSLLETVEACGRGWHKKRLFTYKLEARLGSPANTNVDNSGAPTLIIAEGYRPSTSVYECTVTINGKTYSYPEDFNYEEQYHMEMHPLIKEADLTVETTLTFNLPGHPTLKESLTSKLTNMGTPEATYDGTFILTGTKMFCKVTGGGSEEGYYEGEAPNRILIIHHTGLIKGLPFWLR